MTVFLQADTILASSSWVVEGRDASNFAPSAMTWTSSVCKNLRVRGSTDHTRQQSDDTQACSSSCRQAIMADHPRSHRAYSKKNRHFGRDLACLKMCRYYRSGPVKHCFCRRRSPDCALLLAYLRPVGNNALHAVANSEMPKAIIFDTN
jgi:hypothetical protein